MDGTYHIAMLRPDLVGIPQHPLPEGYSIRTYRPGDEEHWIRIHEKADTHQEVTLETFRQSFGDDLPALQDRGFFLETAQSEVVGTATAWYERGFHGKEYGLVHWVVSADALEDRTRALAERLANGPSVAYRYMKENLNRALVADLQSCLDVEAERMVESAMTEDYLEAVKAFAERRAPAFRGR